MSKRKTKKQKRLAEQSLKERKNQLKELQELKERVEQIQKQISDYKNYNFKEFNIRNLRVVGNTCNFLMPFIVFSGLAVGLFRLFGGGLPFHVDEMVKYKLYSLNYQTNGYITMDESFRSTRLVDPAIPTSNLVIYTPWEYENNQYIRYKRNYQIDKISTLDLFDAVLDENYDFVAENLKDYEEEKQVVNSIEETEDIGYFFDANLYMLDKNITLKYNETELKNIVITIIEIVCGLGAGVLTAIFREYDYLEALNDVQREYSQNLKNIQPLQDELVIINEKILSLSRNKKGNKNED